MPHEIAQALLSHVVDFAGLFPPAELEMPAAVKEFTRQRRNRSSWMLGRFVVPLTRLDELESAAQAAWRRGPARRPWALSVLAGDDFEAERRRIDYFNRVYGDGAGGGRATIRSIELKPTDAGDVAWAARTFEGFDLFFELPHVNDPGPLMAAVAACGGRAKIRSGGVTPEAFPTVEEMARFIAAAARVGIAFKATAGLHHPLRGEYPLTYEEDSPEVTMHGLLNVFLAAAWLKTAAMEEEVVAQLLEVRDFAELEFAAETIRWRDHEISLEAIRAARRHFVLSFGSCSFAEPLAELKALRLA